MHCPTVALLDETVENDVQTADAEPASITEEAEIASLPPAMDCFSMASRDNGVFHEGNQGEFLTGSDIGSLPSSDFSVVSTLT
jgi:hypothetical protein